MLNEKTPVECRAEGACFADGCNLNRSKVRSVSCPFGKLISEWSGERPRMYTFVVVTVTRIYRSHSRRTDLVVSIRYVGTRIQVQTRLDISIWNAISTCRFLNRTRLLLLFLTFIFFCRIFSFFIFFFIVSCILWLKSTSPKSATLKCTSLHTFLPIYPNSIPKRFENCVRTITRLLIWITFTLMEDYQYV